MQMIETNGEEHMKMEPPAEMSLVRCRAAGVHYGHIVSRDGQEVELTNSRRIFYWEGAASLSQLAVDGVAVPENCNFTVRVPTITVLDAIEIIPCSEKAVRSIEGVSEWKR